MNFKHTLVLAAAALAFGAGIALPRPAHAEVSSTTERWCVERIVRPMLDGEYIDDPWVQTTCYTKVCLTDTDLDRTTCTTFRDGGSTLPLMNTW